MTKLNFFATILIGIVFMFSCGNNSPRTINRDSLKKDSIEKIAAESQFSAQKLLDKRKSDADLYLPELLMKFELREDEVKGGGWYRHLKCKGRNKSHLEAIVSTNGYMYLMAHYSGDDWVFANQIFVKVGEQTY